MSNAYPVTLTVDYPDRVLGRATSAFRLFVIIPIAVVLGAIGGFASSSQARSGSGSTVLIVGGTGLLFLPAALMIVFRQKYPRWWFDWNLELLRLTNRVGAFFVLMDDRYPSTDEEQSVHLDLPYPDAREGLNRWLPLVKWFLAIPHYVVLAVLYVGVLFAAIGAWFAIVLTGRYPRGLFSYIEGVMRWHNRVVGYAFVLVTDTYPPFRLRP
jgi:amino acid permease